MDQQSSDVDLIGMSYTPEVFNAGEYNGSNVKPPICDSTVSGGRSSGSTNRRRATVRPSLDADEFMNLLHGSDPVKVELNRLENEVRGNY